ncbi:MAG: hypothetical protein HRU19_32430 [Pseudobacteriovorax sp.]|nr:hypothetical protein [Pseudobacteriovorax sp.]
MAEQLGMPSRHYQRLEAGREIETQTMLAIKYLLYRHITQIDIWQELEKIS